jgi:hypothetical protein
VTVFYLTPHLPVCHACHFLSFHDAFFFSFQAGEDGGFQVVGLTWNPVTQAKRFLMKILTLGFVLRR